MNILQNKTVLITGGSQGIGLAAAKLFIDEGAVVIITGRDLEKLNHAREYLGKNAICVQSDTANLNDITTLFNQIGKMNLKLDALFINAGIAEGGALSTLTEKQFDDQININYKGALFTVKASLNYLNNNASIIFNASIAGMTGIENLSIYSSTKAALINLSQALAIELANKGIRVNAISPGYIRTPLGEKNNRENYNKICETIPLGSRFGEAEEIAKAALFLASDMSSYITGINLIVDGGLSTTLPKIG